MQQPLLLLLLLHLLLLLQQEQDLLQSLPLILSLLPRLQTLPVLRLVLILGVAAVVARAAGQEEQQRQGGSTPQRRSASDDDRSTVAHVQGDVEDGHGLDGREGCGARQGLESAVAAVEVLGAVA